MFPNADKLLGAQMAVPGPGAALSVLRGGFPVFQECWGVAIRSEASIVPDTVFDIASVSKMFTALCILILECEGRLSVHDALADVVPEMKAAAPGVRISHLLTHTSALPDYMDLFDQRGWSLAHRLGLTETLDVLARQPAPSIAPGACYSYSNTGYVLLSAVVECVTGQSLAEAARCRIFEPLGMRNTRYVVSMPPRITGVARSYEAEEGPELMPMWEMTGDGQVYSTVTDLQLWVAELLRPVHFAELVPRLYRPAVLNNGSETAYGSGTQLEMLGNRSLIGHDGGWAGFRSAVFAVPSSDLGVILLSNRANFPAGELAREIISDLLA